MSSTPSPARPSAAIFPDTRSTRTTRPSWHATNRPPCQRFAYAILRVGLTTSDSGPPGTANVITWLNGIGVKASIYAASGSVTQSSLPTSRT